MRNIIILAAIAASSVFSSPIYKFQKYEDISDDNSPEENYLNSAVSLDGDNIQKYSQSAVSTDSFESMDEPSLLQHVIMPTFRDHKIKNLKAPILEYTMGAPVLTNEVNIYNIWYGNWESSDKLIIENFLSRVDETAWYKMMKHYYYQASEESPKVYVNGKVKLAKSINDDYSAGKKLGEGAVADIIRYHIEKNNLPEDESAVYNLFTASDVEESMQEGASFGDEYCGYHISFEMKSGKMGFVAMVGHPANHLENCSSSLSADTAPNNPAIDSVTSALAHELVEAVSDPDSIGVRAWQDSQFYENGDKCAYTYGKVSKHDGKNYNMKIGDYYYLIQQNWDIVSQSCKMG